MTAKTIRSRRKFLKETGGLLLGFSLVDSAILPRLLAAPPVDAVQAPAPDQLDAWLKIEPSGVVRVFTGKVEIGMGVETGLMQIVAEELDVPPARVVFVMGDTATTANQGGVGGSTSISLGAKPLRNAAATARSMLVQLASRRLGAPADRLEVRNGVVFVKGSKAKRISYGELARTTELKETLKVSGDGFALNAEGLSKPKDPAQYTVVGKSVARVDLGPKIMGRWKYVTDVRVPGMLHGRVIRPSSAGAKLVSVDDEAVKKIPGYVKTVVKGNFVGVVAEREWSAIRASSALNVKWSAPEQKFPDQEQLYNYMRTTPPQATKETLKKGDAQLALSTAARKLEANYEFPFQSHATMGPGCAVADVRADGTATIWSGTQKPHALQKGIGELLNIPAGKTRIIWVEDSGSYGRPGFDDTAADAALLSQAVGKPVRVQWTRADMTAWGSKGPAVTCEMTAGLDAQGQVTAMQFTSRAFSGAEIMYFPDSAGNFLAGQSIGIPNTSGRDEFAQWGAETASYAFPNIYANAHVVPSFLATESPLRGTHLRDPQGPAASFATESFMDEIAATTGVDPVEFRLKYLDDARGKAVLMAAAQKFGWDSRPSPKKALGTSGLVTGRGVAVGERGGTRVATIAEVEVNRGSGAVRVRRLVCAHDCGLIINPDALRGTIAANLIQSLSRTLMEEVTFDRSNVTSVDWKTYPVARASDIPDQVDIVLINHPEIPSTGAGEPSTRLTPAAINNAVYDATGVRIRRGPLTSARIQAALESSRSS